MPSWCKGIWIFATFVNAMAIIWYLLGSTANFNRSLDLVGTVILILEWVPSLILTTLSVALLFKGWAPSKNVASVVLFTGVFLLLVLSVHLFQSVNIHGWLIENVRSDSMKTTSDQKYEYRVDLINLFQKNSRGQLFVRSISSGKETKISISIDTDKVVALRIIKEGNNWGYMEPSEVPDHYYLYTTKELGIPKEKFEIDIEAGISKRLN